MGVFDLVDVERQGVGPFIEAAVDGRRRGDAGGSDEVGVELGDAGDLIIDEDFDAEGPMVVSGDGSGGVEIDWDGGIGIGLEIGEGRLAQEDVGVLQEDADGAATSLAVIVVQR